MRVLICGEESERQEFIAALADMEIDIEVIDPNDVFTKNFCTSSEAVLEGNYHDWYYELEQEMPRSELTKRIKYERNPMMKAELQKQLSQLNYGNSKHRRGKKVKR